MNVRPLLVEVVTALPVPENGRDADPQIIANQLISAAALIACRFRTRHRASL
jgi:hypothetical protein